MLSLLSELTEQFLPGQSEEAILRRNRLKGRSFEILCKSEEGSSWTGGLSPFDNMSIAAYELRDSGCNSEGQRLEDLIDSLPKSAHPLLSICFQLRSSTSKPSSSKETRSNNPRSYPMYPKELFKKDLNKGLSEGLSPPSPSSLSLFRVIPPQSTSNNYLVPIPPLSLTLNAEGQRIMRVPRKRHENQLEPKIEEDQGYTSASEDAEEHAPPFPWEKILSLEAPSSGLRRNWEHLGVIDPLKELPYITEYSGGVLQAWALGWSNLRMSNPDVVSIPPSIIRREDEIITDIGYLMIGIASRSFGFNSSNKEFFVTPGLCQENLTPETLASYVKDYVTCGTYFRRLERFVEKKNLLEGLIFQCFQTGVQNYLDGFRAMVLKIVSVKRSLLELSKALRPLCKHVLFLAELCKVTVVHSSRRDDLPRGIRLLSHLFDMTYFVNTKDLYFVLISILRITAGPYFRFLERWVFEGVCQDDFSEFGLIENGSAASYRDRRYWNYAYVVENNLRDEVQGCAGLLGGASFISDIQNQIYECGKALNFLKLCCSDHFLCCTTSESQPKIQLLVSLAEEQKLKKEVTDYTEMMTAIAMEKSKSIKMHNLNLAKEKKNLAEIARVKHMENVKRIESKVVAERLRHQEKKRMILEDLQEQVRLDVKRREEMKSAKLREDKKWMEMALKREKEDIRREELARKEVEERYRSLSAAVERREIVARWRLKRHALRASRIKFWRAENQVFQDHVQNQVFQDHVQNQINNEESLTREEPLTTSEPLTNSSLTWKPLRIKKDDMNNIILEFEDSESNVLSINVDNWSSFSDEEQSHIISTGNVNQLNGWMKERLLENYPKTNVPVDNLTTQTPKANTKNRITASSIVFEECLSTGKAKRGFKDKRDPSSVVDGRKRPKSKHIEDVLYKQSGSEPQSFQRPPPTEFNFNFTNQTPEYTKNYGVVFSSPIGNDFSDRLLVPKREVIDSQNPEATNLQNSTSNTVIPLRILMENSILIPLRTQKALVNQAVLNYILVDAELMSHFEACRNFLLFHDGEFGHKLSFSIFDEFFQGSRTRDLMNPTTLNRLVDNAILSCTHRNSKTIHNVGFKRLSVNLNETVEDILSHLVLTYRIQWPYNIILTSEALDKYGELFKFLFQLKKTVWALMQAYQHLKQMGKSTESLFHRLHLMRNEMLNFITVAEGYISTQVLELCWQEFQDDLENKVKSLDELYEAHEKYLNKALFRCLLNKKARPVQKIISDIFQVIIKFSLTLTSKTSSSALEGDSALFRQLEDDFNLFKKYSSFLYQVVSKLAVRGYQHHLYDLMLRLNFSGFYQASD